MLNNILEEEDDCFVFFYEENDPDAHSVLAELEGRFWRQIKKMIWRNFILIYFFKLLIIAIIDD